MFENDVRSRTYNYLRLSLIAVVGGLFVALGVEWLESSGCFQTSVSAYYYTPVQAVFVGALVALGVGMVAMYGRDAVEDAFLNLAGLFAPVVAFVPTVRANRCGLVQATGGELPNNVGPSQVVDGAQVAIDNNMWAFFAVVLVALVAMAVIRRKPVLSAVRPKGRGDNRDERAPTGPSGFPYLLSYVIAAIAWVVGIVAFLWMRQAFYDRAHGVSAILLFLCVIVVVFSSAHLRVRKPYEQRRAADPGIREWKALPLVERLLATLKDRYGVLGLTMIVSVLAIAVYAALATWDHWVLAIEATLIALFGVFWVLQTIEHWAPPEEQPAPPRPEALEDRELGPPERTATPT